MGESTLETTVDGDSTGEAIVILPSYGRDTGRDYDRFAELVSDGGGLVLRPQPRGVGRSKAAMHGVTLRDLADDVIGVIDALGGGRAHVLGHAFGNYVARVVGYEHGDKAASVILAAAQGPTVPEEIASTPMRAGELSASREDRLAALRLGFFAPGHDPSIWLDGWYPDTLAMEEGAVKSDVPRKADFWGAGDAPILELIAANDPFHQRSQWDDMRRRYGARVTSVVIEDASHALFPEQPQALADNVLNYVTANRR